MNSTKLPNFISARKKEKVNANHDWSILDKGKQYSSAAEKCMLCFTEKYQIMFCVKNMFSKPSSW